MSDPANQLNVPSDAPIGVYRTPNVNPGAVRDDDVSFGASGQDTVNSPGTTGVTTGGTGQPVSNGG
jgi:hypothetical protein